ncbi:hypothetical protein Taro_055177 [Colocasia esculenta]|uniref:Uncharacterized protein n=1 Tax=Colocasia esculenta TaxID=4460 RepID=A0A843XQS6_COLES|nr:hypothetical protein [Colocasia esculenta]
MLAIYRTAKQDVKAVVVLTIYRLRKATLINKRQNQTSVQAKVETATLESRELMNWFATPETDSDNTHRSTSQSRSHERKVQLSLHVKSQATVETNTTPPPADHTVAGPCLAPLEILAWTL